MSNIFLFFIFYSVCRPPARLPVLTVHQPITWADTRGGWGGSQWWVGRGVLWLPWCVFNQLVRWLRCFLFPAWCFAFCHWSIKTPPTATWILGAGFIESADYSDGQRVISEGDACGLLSSELWEGTTSSSCFLLNFCLNRNVKNQNLRAETRTSSGLTDARLSGRWVIPFPLFLLWFWFASRKHPHPPTAARREMTRLFSTSARPDVTKIIIVSLDVRPDCILKILQLFCLGCSRFQVSVSGRVAGSRWVSFYTSYITF